jgi:hypothetical protein
LLVFTAGSIYSWILKGVVGWGMERWFMVGLKQLQGKSELASTIEGRRDTYAGEAEWASALGGGVTTGVTSSVGRPRGEGSSTRH